MGWHKRARSRYSKRLFINGVPAITSLPLTVPVGSQTPHSCTLAVFGVKHPATLTIMIPFIASMIVYVVTSTATERLVCPGKMISWIGDKGRGACEGNKVCESNENFHVELQFHCQRCFCEEYIGPTWTKICKGGIEWTDVCGSMEAC